MNEMFSRHYSNIYKESEQMSFSFDTFTLDLRFYLK